MKNVLLAATLIVGFTSAMIFRDKPSTDQFACGMQTTLREISKDLPSANFARGVSAFTVSVTPLVSPTDVAQIDCRNLVGRSMARIVIEPDCGGWND